MPEVGSFPYCFGWIYDRFSGFPTYGTLIAAVLNEGILIRNFVYKKILQTLEYSKSFRQSQCILLEIIYFQEMAIYHTESRFALENNLFWKYSISIRMH